MATIFQTGPRLLSGPFAFQWTDECPSTGPNASAVVIDGIVPTALDTIAGGEQFILSRGSTAQIGVTVTLAAPGGGPGTKTVEEIVTDIQGVFGASFASVVNGHVRLRDTTSGPNIGRASVDDYVGADDAAKNALFAAIGLPTSLTRTVGTTSTARQVDYKFENDNISMISSNAMTLPPGTREVKVALQIGAAKGDKILPIVAFAFSDGNVFEPASFMTVSSSLIDDAIVSPTFDGNRIAYVSVGTIAGSVIVSSQAAVTSLVLRAQVDPTITKLRLVLPGIRDAGTPKPSWRTGPYVTASAWAIG